MLLNNFRGGLKNKIQTVLTQKIYNLTKICSRFSLTNTWKSITKSNDKELKVIQILGQDRSSGIHITFCENVASVCFNIVPLSSQNNTVAD